MPKVTITDKKGLVQSAGGGMTVSSPFTLSTPDIAVAGTTYGAGAIGTSDHGAPKLRRWIENGLIVTQISVDLTGLAVLGTTANEAIGLAAGGAAYIYKNVVADNGIICQYTVQMLEAGSAAGGTITDDINLNWDTDGTIAYSEAVSATGALNSGTLVAGQTATKNTAAITADFYLYLVPGDTDASTGTYNAGQLLITLYGYALLT